MIKGVAEKEAYWSVDRFPLKPKQDSTTDRATAAEDPEEIRQHRLRFRNKIKTILLWSYKGVSKNHKPNCFYCLEATGCQSWSTQSHTNRLHGCP